MTNSLPITDWRLFFLLSALALASAIPLIPVVVVQGEAGLIAEPLGWRITAAAVLMGALLVYPAAVFVGLRIGGKLGLAAPLAEAWLAGRQPEDAAGRLSAGLALGAGFGLTGVIIALTQSGSTGEAEAASADIIPLWIGLAQAVSAGFGKEVLFRFGLMSLLAWFAWRVLPGRDGSPSAFGMWFAIAALRAWPLPRSTAPPTARQPPLRPCKRCVCSPGRDLAGYSGSAVWRRRSALISPTIWCCSMAS